MSQQPKQYSAQINAKLVVAAIQGPQTMAELASQYGVRANHFRQWKKQALAE